MNEIDTLLDVRGVAARLGGKCASRMEVECERPNTWRAADIAKRSLEGLRFGAMD